MLNRKRLVREPFLLDNNTMAYSLDSYAWDALGIGRSGRILFLDATLDYREYGLPLNLVVIENCDEWLNCIDCSTGKVVTWSPYDKDGVIPAYPDFDSFVLDSFSEAITNL